MDTHTVIRAYAKVNLSLGVGPIRPDGYHPVEMVLASVDLYDTIDISIRDRGIILTADTPGLPIDGRNIAHRAASAYLRAAGIKKGVRIKIRKGIPIAAGLAGGSADAAAVLGGLQRLFGDPLPQGILSGIAGELGSDVPFCLSGGLALATGRGTDLQPLRDLAEGPVFVIVNPGIPVSTAAVYRQFDRMPPGPWPDTSGLTAALAEGDWQGAASRMVNMLEPAACSLCPGISPIRDALLREGAIAARMSGSGPTVYGFFVDREKARAAADSLRGLYPFVRVAQPAPTGIAAGEGKTQPMQNY